MPSRSRTPCLHPGCPNLVDKGDRGRCELHRKAHNRMDTRERGSASARGYDSRWSAFRAQYLRRNPICACGCGQAAQEIHHIVPVKGPDDPGFYDEENLMGLTKACHSKFTMKALNKDRET